MKRRNLLQHGGLAGILAASSSPALAQSLPEIRWRLASSFPKSLDTIYGGADTVARTIGVPVGVITALLGAPFLLWQLRRTQSGYAL